MKKLFSIALFSLIVLLSSQSFAQQSKHSNIASAMGTILSGKGDITQSQYDDFWRKIGVQDQSEKRQIIIFMKRNFLSVKDYQREIWECAKQAWEEEKYPECSKLQLKFNILEGDLSDADQKEALALLTEASGKIIQAAADHGNLVLEEGGREVPMSLALINQTKSSLDQTFARFNRIFQLEYSTDEEDPVQDDSTSSLNY